MGLNNPGAPGGNLPAGEDHIMRRLADLERAYRELVASGPSMFASTFASIEANLASINALIGNEVQIGSASVLATNFATSATNTSVATGTITVPAGYSQALVFATATAGIWNRNAVGEYLYLNVGIIGIGSRQITVGMAPSSFGSASTSKATLLPGLSGGTIAFAAILRTDSAIPAQASNMAAIEAIVVFLR